MCFQHPFFPNRCIKTMIPGRIAELRRRATWYKRLAGNSHFDDNLREVTGYKQRALRNSAPDNVVWQHLPRWYGVTATSEGPGAVSELIQDDYGQPAMTLEVYLQNFGLNPRIRGALNRFCVWLRTTGVLTKNLLPHNLVICEKSEHPELYLIDGLGCAAAIPLPEYFEAPRQHYVERRIERMWKRIHWELSGRNIPWKTAEKL
ncbi:YrbL family protein [Microbulbifer agarilyticus]|nr:YrbL family protein [Microbulbifer agarilyticus]